VRKTANFLKNRRGAQLSREESDALEAAMGEVETVPARKVIVRRGEPVRNATLLVSGYMCRYMDDRHGYRQLVAIHVPGDFVDLHGYPLQRLDHDIAALSPCTVAGIPHARLTELTERYPHLGRLMWFATLLDSAMHREWIFQLGRLDAAGRVAHLLCETQARMAAIGMAEDGGFDWPLTQQDLGEATGLTAIHVNRVLARLRKAELAEVRNRRVYVRDLPKLAVMGEFERDYLYFDDEYRVP
jgi:CRP-like cAMP-binding protein